MSAQAFPLMGFERHRMATDGRGVTTLAAAWGCPLRCAMCLNRQCTRKETPVKRVSPRELYAMTRPDDLYFRATGGGVTFGGGEPLLQADFIAEFVQFLREKGENWRISAESCLAVPEENLRAVMPYIDEWIVDVKDMNDGIYRKYTGRESSAMKANLAILAAECPEKVLAKVPLIPGFNEAEDVLRSQMELEKMGFSRIARLKYQTEIKK